MQLVIDIPEHHYNNIMAFSSVNLGRVPYKGIIAYAINAIKNGTPLPKGHGKIIDTSELLTVTDIREDGSEFIYIPYSEIENALTIIEADRMDREEVTKWLKIMKANLNTFPEISSEKKIEALAEAIRLLKNEQSENPTGSDDCING